MVRKLYETPDDLPGEFVCRTLKIPSSYDWLGIFNKALLTMTNEYNWEQVEDTDMTIPATIEVINLMLVDYWATPDCGDGGSCDLGDGIPPFRLGVDGHYQQFQDGAWVTPNGDFEIPATLPREETTAEERRCAAAANAANVIMLTYEAITDEIALGGDTLQVAAAMVAYLVSALGGWIAAPVYAIIELSIALFVGLIELLQVLGGDVWTEGFNEQLKCAFLNCSTDDGDVVTFDLTCIREELNQPPNLLNTDWFYELQLFAQVLFLLETITMDGLNAAGATTGITEAECDCGVCLDCTTETADGASFVFDTIEDIGGWTHNRHDAQDASKWYLLPESYAGGHGEFVNAADACIISLAWNATGSSPFIIKIGDWTGGPFSSAASPQFPPDGTHGDKIEVYLPDGYGAGTTYLSNFSFQYCL